MRIIYKQVNSSHGKRLANQVVHLIGNGPSLASANLSALMNTGRIFVCNGYAHGNIQNIYPMLYFLGDPSYSNKEYLASEGIIEELTTVFSHIAIFTTETIAEALGQYAAENLQDIECTLVLLHSKFIGGNPVGPFKCIISEGVEHYQNILVLMLQVAIFMGATTICLHGFDFGNILGYPLIVEKHHFYDLKPISQWDSSFDTPASAQVEYFRSAYLTLMQLSSLKQLALERGIRIINYSPDSLLEAFDKNQRLT